MLERLMQVILEHSFINEIREYPTLEYNVEVFESICDVHIERIERESGLEKLKEVENSE